MINRSLLQIQPFGPCADHFAGAEYQCSCARLPYSHYDSSKTFRVVFRISGMKRYFLQIQLTRQVHGTNDISVKQLFQTNTVRII